MIIAGFLLVTDTFVFRRTRSCTFIFQLKCSAAP